MHALKQFLGWFFLSVGHPWRDYWLAEAVRLQEAERGRFDDAVVNQQVAAQQLPWREALIARAVLLAQALGYEKQQEQILRWYQRVLILAGIVMLLVGGATSVGFLAESNGQVNLLWAVLLFVGLNGLAMLIWCVLMAWQSHGNQGQWLFDVMEWLSGRKKAPLVQALVTFAHRQGASQWLASVITHALWLMLMLGLWVGLWLKLLTQDYSFLWGSTLLFSEHIVPLVVALGEPATWLGFTMPDAELVRATGESLQSGELERFQWGAWLLWVVLILGVFPRLLLLLFAMGQLWRLRKPVPLPLPPNWLVLQAQLCPPTVGVTDARGKGAQAPVVAASEQSKSGAALVWVGYELTQALAETLTFEPSVTAFPQVDGRGAQTQVLMQLAALPQGVKRVLLVCNAQLTPDRGFQRFAVELKAQGAQVGVLLLAQDETQWKTQAPMWQAQAQALELEWAQNSHWLEEGGSSWEHH